MPPDSDDDATLVSRCLRGESAAWAALVQRYQRLVYAVAMRIGHDEHVAADVFQTVFARLVQHLPQIAEPHRLQAWIVTTAKREALLLRRRGQLTTSLSRDEGDDAPDWDFADDAPIAEEVLSELQQVHQLRLGLERLDERCRELLRLLFRDDDDSVAYDEVARRMDMPVGSIGPTRARCLGKLRRLVA